MINFVKIQVSLFSLLLLLFVHSGAFAFLFLLTVLPFTKLCLSLIIFSSAYYSLTNNLQLSATSIKKISASSRQPWILQLRSKEIVVAQVSSASIVTRYFMLLHLKPIVGSRQIGPLLFWYDSLPKLELWQLRRILAVSSVRDRST